MKRSGIYQLRHVESGRVYVGSAIDIDGRFYRHRSQLSRAKHANRYLQAAWDKYGVEAFVFEVLELVPEPADLVVREQHWIDALGACGSGFNVSPTAYSILGLKRSEETKTKHREAWKRRGPIPPDVRERMNAAKRGKPLSADHRAKIGAASMGHPVSAEARARIGAAAASRRYGSPTEERRRAVSQRHRGEGNWAAKITEDDVREIRRRLAEGQGGSDIARDMGLHKLTVSKIKCGRTWTHVT